MGRLTLAALIAALASPAWAADPPPGVARQLPPGHEALTAVRAVPSGAREYWIVALARQDEDAGGRTPDPAPVHPLVLFARQPDGSFLPAGRNGDAVMRAGEGGQCDPFEDGAAAIAVKGRYFTVQNGVACGQHWTDYVTFRFDPARGGFVFDNERIESWSLNRSTAPGAPALVQDRPTRVQRSPPGRTVTFDA